MTRLFVERLDNDVLKKYTTALDKQQGSLKRLASILSGLKADGRRLTQELAGIYDLRHVDSHLPSSTYEDSYSLLRIEKEESWLRKGQQAIAAVASSCGIDRKGI